MLEATAFWTTAPGQGALRREALRVPGPDEVLVEASFSGISRGSERLVYQGLVPASQHQAMRAPFQA
ncbi:MAG: dehydrogenase, partial [Geminicoccaceae bacterium]